MPMDRKALIRLLRRGEGTNGPGTDAYSLMQRAALVLECEGDDDDGSMVVQINLGDGAEFVKFMLGLRALQREIAEDEPETAARIGALIDEWERTK